MRFFIKLQYNTSNCGISVLESIIVLALLGLVGLKMADYCKLSLRSANYLQVSGELEDARNYIRNGMDCGTTFTDQVEACTSGAPIEIRRNDSSIVVSKNLETPSSIGADIELSARCEELGGFLTVSVNYRRMKNGIPRLDPLNHSKAVDWASLFPQIPLTCPLPIAEKCIGQPRLKKTFALPFLADTTTCNWAKGKGYPAGDYIAAMEPQFKSFSLDEGVSKGICSMAITTKTPNFTVDDEVIFTIGATKSPDVDYIMFSDWFGEQTFSAVKSLMSGNVFQLQREKFYSLKWTVQPHATRRTYCADGIDCTGTVRNNTKSGVVGTVHFNTSLDFFKNLPVAFLASRGFRVGLWNDGTDDAGDCKNSAITLDVEVEYVD